MNLAADLVRVAAGICRSADAHGAWRRFNAHTLRHSYVTRNLARGVSEDLVRMHTGHRSNELRRYREFASSFAELKLEELTPLNEAIPELSRVGQVEKRVPGGAGDRDENPNLLN